MYRSPTQITRSAARIASLRKSAAAHKYDHGHVLVLSGGPGHTGAARLAARAALRIGAGLVTLGVPPAAQSEVAAQVTAVMIMRIADAAALEEALGDARIGTLCLGPGLGTARAAEMIAPALAGTRRAVLDADALTAMAQDASLFAKLHENCILTPHAGEFARLFPDLAAPLGQDETLDTRVGAVRAAAARAGCTVLLKGADTVIAAPGGAAAIHAAQGAEAAPWLATAGAGDVLAGMIAGLLARGAPVQEAAETAVWLHALCARRFGPGLIAEDLPEELPKVLADLAV